MKSKSKMTRVFVGSFVPIALVLMLSLRPGGAQAATFVVNSTADDVDAAPGNGACATAGGVCTLRAAIMEANAVAGADSITLPAGTYTSSIPGTGENAAATGDLDMTGNLNINGAGAASTIIDGGGIDRVFEVRPGATVEIDGVTVRNGKPGAGGTGGGGISNQGTMTLTNSTVTSSTDGIGGGIYNHGTMTVNSSTVSGNSGAGGVYSSADGLGGGIFNDGTMTINRSTVSGNTAPGVYWFSPGGGGIFNNIPGSMTLTNSTVSGNAAGTGVVNLSSSLTIESSTVSGNTGNTGYGGGGVLNFSWTAIATTSVFSSTIAENRNLTSRGDAIADAFSPPGSVVLKNSVVASPTQGLGDDCNIAAGVLTSLGHNIASDASCGLTGSGDLNSTDPLLGTLADNGGPTLTHAPLLGSPAADAVPLADCTDANDNPIATDQRGVARPQGVACEIGAYEVEAEITVAIDIKPGSFPNSINPKSKGVIPVAILTTATFDATTVDPTTVLFGATGTEAVPVHSALEDVDGDGDTDMILHFNSQATEIQCGDTSASLTGETLDGQMIQGSDAINTVGCK